MQLFLFVHFLASGFPFTEVSLTGCNFDWFRSDPSILADILHNLTSTNALTQLSLPLRPVAIAQNEEVQLRICDGLSRLKHCEKLVDLDLGAQIIGQQEFDSLLVALQSLRRLVRLSVTDLPYVHIFYWKLTTAIIRSTYFSFLFRPSIKVFPMACK